MDNLLIRNLTMAAELIMDRCYVLNNSVGLVINGLRSYSIEQRVRWKRE